MKQDSGITKKDLECFAAGGEPRCRRIATNAASKTGLSDLAFCGEDAAKLHYDFSVEIETMPVTNQKSSGRCWLFAALNVLRVKIGKELKMENFELSQSYAAFWDKFERANYFLEAMIETAHLDADDRTVSYILQTGVHDGGQWGMFANLVEKYGVAPKNVFPETFQSSNTGMMNGLLNTSLKANGIRLREMIAKGAGDEAVSKARKEMLGEIYRFLCVCYGNPPESFDFEYTDKEKAYHIEKGFTPQSFAKKYLGSMIEDTVSIIHAPTKDKPYQKMYTVQYLGNVVEGRPVTYLNLPMDEFKALVIKQMEAGEVVWFGSDVSKFGDRSGGLWDDKSFDFPSLTGLNLTLSKEERLDYRDSSMCHAMVLTGVNLEDGKPSRWKIENSWGDDRANKGYYICSDSWFDEFVYQAVIDRKYLAGKEAILAGEPIVLKPWDPMGSLAD